MMKYIYCFLILSAFSACSHYRSAQVIHKKVPEVAQAINGCISNHRECRSDTSAEAWKIKTSKVAIAYKPDFQASLPAHAARWGGQAYPSGFCILLRQLTVMDGKSTGLNCTLHDICGQYSIQKHATCSAHANHKTSQPEAISGTTFKDPESIFNVFGILCLIAAIVAALCLLIFVIFFIVDFGFDGHLYAYIFRGLIVSLIFGILYFIFRGLMDKGKVSNKKFAKAGLVIDAVTGPLYIILNILLLLF